MPTRPFLASAMIMLGLSAVVAQPTPAGPTPTQDPSTVIPEKIEPAPSGRDSAPARAGETAAVPTQGLPDGCRRAATLAGQGDMPMDGGLPPPAPEAANRLNGTQRALMQAMTRMHATMMQGMAAKDADVAWICAMIPHHQGAIEMARAGLLGADNAESRRMAEETIRMQQQEIARLTRWVEQNAERESRNESGTSPVRP